MCEAGLPHAGRDPRLRRRPGPHGPRGAGARRRVCRGRSAGQLQFGDQGRTIRARKAKNLRFQVGGQWVSKKQVKVNIPARPFLGLSDEDMQEIKATTEEFIGRDD